MIQIIASAVVGIVVALLVAADLAYPDFHRAHLTMTAQSNAVDLYLAFVVAYFMSTLVAWVGGIVLDLSAIHRIVQTSSGNEFARARKRLSRGFDGTLIAMIIAYIRPDERIGEDRGNSTLTGVLSGIRQIRGELWRVALRRLMTLTGVFLAVAVVAGLITFRFAPANPVPAIVIVSGIVTFLLVVIAVSGFVWALIDREMEGAGSALIGNMVSAPQEPARPETNLVPFNDRYDVVDDRSVGPHLQRIEQSVVQGDAMIREDLRTIASLLGALATSYERTTQNAVTRQTRESWEHIEAALAEIKEELRDLTVTTASRAVTVVPARFDTMPSGKADPAAVARRVRAMLDDLGASAE